MDIKKRKIKGNNAPENDSDIYLKKHVGLIHCENRLTLMQRKICNVLLYNALDTINEQDIHEIQLKQLCSLVGYNSNDTKLIKDSIRSLISTILEWNLLDDYKFINENNYPEEMITWNASSLLAGASIRKGTVRYSYSPQIKPVLSSLEIYGRINLFVQAKFSSAYSLVLYENCVRFKNINQSSTFSLKLFRSLMGVTEGKYLSFKEFRRNVINVAVKEVNQKSDILIEPDFRKTGRAVSSIQFKVYDNESYQPSFRKPQTVKRISDATQEISPLSEQLVSEYGLSERQVKQIMKNYDKAYILQKIQLVESKKNIKHPGAYLISALQKDYQQPGQTIHKTKLIVPEQSSIREAKVASEITPLKNKYMSYKLQTFMGYIEQQAEVIQTNIHEAFAEYLKPKTQIFKTYQKKKLSSPFVMTEFLTFIEKHFSDIIGEYMTFDDYMTSEDVC